MRASRELAFAINDVARLLRTYADQQARRVGMTRAQWAVLVRLDACEGLKQAEIAEMLDLQPITLTRLLDKLAKSGLIERRTDPTDRRANRLYLTPAARPLLDALDRIGAEIMDNVLEGLDEAARGRLRADLSTMKTNLRRATSRAPQQTAVG